MRMTQVVYFALGDNLMNFPGLPGISGMVKVGANDFVVVHDTKGPLGARLGAIRYRRKAQDTRAWSMQLADI